jgi:hypothetical protein
VVRSSVRRASQARGDGPWGTMGHHGAPWALGERWGNTEEIWWE